MWELRIKHEGLHAYRTVRGVTQAEAETKARLQMDAWNARWTRLAAREAAQQERLKKRTWADKRSDIDKRAKDHALELTKDAEAVIDGLRSLLTSTLRRSHALDWESLKDTSKFTKPEPPLPKCEAIPVEPLRTDPQYFVIPDIATIKLMDWTLPGARAKKLTAAKAETERRTIDTEQRFAQAHAAWEQRAQEVADRYQSALANREKAKASWLIERRTFAENQRIFNSEVDDSKSRI